jgi:hypothetical protein
MREWIAKAKRSLAALEGLHTSMTSYAKAEEAHHESAGVETTASLTQYARDVHTAIAASPEREALQVARRHLNGVELLRFLEDFQQGWRGLIKSLEKWAPRLNALPWSLGELSDEGGPSVARAFVRRFFPRQARDAGFGYWKEPLAAAPSGTTREWVSSQRFPQPTQEDARRDDDMGASIESEALKRELLTRGLLKAKYKEARINAKIKKEASQYADSVRQAQHTNTFGLVELCQAPGGAILDELVTLGKMEGKLEAPGTTIARSHPSLHQYLLRQFYHILSHTQHLEGMNSEVKGTAVHKNQSTELKESVLFWKHNAKAASYIGTDGTVATHLKKGDLINVNRERRKDKQLAKGEDATNERRDELVDKAATICI